MNTLGIWFAAIFVAVAVSAAPALMDGPSEAESEWDQSTALRDLQASEAGTVRREKAAQKLCNEARGPNSEARWLPTGELVCTTRRGVVAVAL